MASHPYDVLESVGVTVNEEAVYRALLRSPAATATSLAKEVSLPRAELRSTIHSLEAKGLVSRLPGKPDAFTPAPPEVGLEVLVLRRAEELERVRLVARQWQEQFRHIARDQDLLQQVEVVGGLAVEQRYRQLLRTVKGEFIGMDMAPGADSLLKEIKPSVRYRVIYDAAVVESTDDMARLEAFASAGEVQRTLHRLPLLFAGADRELGIVPLNPELSGEFGGVLLIHAGHLLSGLFEVFELLWDRATPIHARSDSAGEADLSPADRRLLTLLAAGLKDQAIARQLGIGLSTVERRIKRLLERLGARTRFQAGIQAARRGWMEG